MAICEQDDAARNQRAQEKTTASASERFSNALASIDRQAPSLTYLGLGCWIAWNTIAFSGSFWLHETDNSNITENLMLVHLLACFITLLLVALFADRFSKWGLIGQKVCPGHLFTPLRTGTLSHDAIHPRQAPLPISAERLPRLP